MSKLKQLLFRLDNTDRIIIEEKLKEKEGQINQLQQQLEEKDKEVKELKEWKDWYSMWHDKFKKQIDELTTELETYRPTKLHGNGQCKCHKCQAIHWTDWCNSYKGHIYCNNCLNEVLENGGSNEKGLFNP